LREWKTRADDVSGFAIPDCGYFVSEEQPEICLQAILEFFEKKNGNE
jgi:haloacetate dehalogenase